MSRSKHKRQCARRHCTCKPRHQARRRRDAIADERRDPRAVGSIKDDPFDITSPRHRMWPSWSKRS